MNRIKNITRPRAARSAAIGALVTAMIDAFLLTVRHAALVANSAKAPAQPVALVVATGSVFTFVTAGVIAFAALVGWTAFTARRAPVITRDITPETP